MFAVELKSGAERTLYPLGDGPNVEPMPPTRNLRLHSHHSVQQSKGTEEVSPRLQIVDLRARKRFFVDIMFHSAGDLE